MKILLVIDGSGRMQPALALTTEIAFATKAQVSILGLIGKGEDEERLDQALVLARENFQSKGVAAEITSKQGEPIDEIVRRVAGDRQDLVVIGAERKEDRGSLFLSSKIYHIVEAIPSPVLVAFGSKTDMKRILIATGGGDYIDNVVRFVGEISRNLSTLVTLLHVTAEAPAIHADIIRLQEDVDRVLKSNSALGRNLRNQKRILETFGITAGVRLRHGIVIEELLEEAREGDYDLIVTGSRPVSNPLRNYFFGNLTREIIGQADRPVLVVRSDKRPRTFLEWLTGKSVSDRSRTLV